MTGQFSSIIADSVFDYCSDFIAVMDLDFKCILCNKAFTGLFNLSSNTFQNKYLTEIIPEKNYEVIKNNLKEILKDKQPKTFILNLNKDKIINITLSPIIDKEIITGILTIGRDITNEENLKIKLVEKVYQLNSLLEYLPVLVYMKDRDLNYIAGSKYAKKFVAEGLDPYTDNVLIDIDKIKSVTDYEDKQVILNKHILNKEKSIPDIDGNEHWYKICKAPISDWNNNAAGIVTIAQNIDNEKKLELQKELFIATLTHDLKNPLLAQISSLSLLSKGIFGSLSEKQQEIINIILESSIFMKEMIHSILSTYKFENGYAKLNKSDFDIENLIDTCIKEVSNMAKTRNIEFMFDSKLTLDNKIINADETQLRRVISNILNNMVNYAFKNTKIEISIKQEGKNIIFSFSNLSPEISKEIKQHIFDKYISGSSEYKKTGFGLGLYFSKKVIEAHKGSIYLIGNKTNNSFIFEIPIAEYSSKKEASINLA
ncbi:MAG: ATP-binding protein [Candidatus Gastranaerophilales bacterium]|nr:ATP-binding protein [Candidatus Gastranaerophilales bacterium]